MPKITTLNFLSKLELVHKVEDEVLLGKGQKEVFTGSKDESVISLLGRTKGRGPLILGKQHLNFHLRT